MRPLEGSVCCFFLCKRHFRCNIIQEDWKNVHTVPPKYILYRPFESGMHFKGVPLKKCGVLQKIYIRLLFWVCRLAVQKIEGGGKHANPLPEPYQVKCPQHGLVLYLVDSPRQSTLSSSWWGHGPPPYNTGQLQEAYHNLEAPFNKPRVQLSLLSRDKLHGGG